MQGHQQHCPTYKIHSQSQIKPQIVDVNSMYPNLHIVMVSKKNAMERNLKGAQYIHWCSFQI